MHLNIERAAGCGDHTDIGLTAGRRVFDDEAAVSVKQPQIEVRAITVAHADDLVLVTNIHLRGQIPALAGLQPAAERLADLLEALLR